MFNYSNKLKSKKGQAMLLTYVVGTSLVIATVVSSFTTWLLSMKNNEHEIGQTLQGQNVAMNKWDEVVHQSPEEKKNNKNKVDVTTDPDGNVITVRYGNRGVYENGKCNTAVSEDRMIKAYQTCTDVGVSVKDKEGKPLYQFNSVSLLSSTYVYPIGSIIPYTGNLNKIPDGWALCDGTNGTPNLNEKFLKGTSNQSEIGQTGGNNEYVLEQKNLPSATFNIAIPDRLIASGSHMTPIPDSKAILDMICSWNGNVMLYMHDLATYIHIPGWESKPFPVAPRHKTTAYIMKIK